MTGAASHFRILARLALRGLRSRGEVQAPPAAPRRRVAVERPALELHPERMAAYLRATDGERIAAFRGPDAVVPPVYPATWEVVATLELLAQMDVPLPLGGAIHLESELLPVRPLRPGDRVRSRVEMERVEATPRGLRLTIAGRSWNGSGQLCSEGTALFLLRSRDPSGRKPPREEAPPPGEGWEELARWSLRSGAGRRYARASGDYNPIHLWGLTARPFGFRRPILHGFCTEAMVAHALIERRFGGDPAALRRLRIAFRAPVLLPARLRLLVRAGEGAGGAFRVVGDGERTLAEGEFAGG